MPSLSDAIAAARTHIANLPPIETLSPEEIAEQDAKSRAKNVVDFLDEFSIEHDGSIHDVKKALEIIARYGRESLLANNGRRR